MRQDDGAFTLRGCDSNESAHCAACTIRQGPPEWSVLDDAEIRLLESSRVTNVYRVGQVLFYQGNHCLGIHCIQSGEVAVRKTNESGSSMIVRLAHGGQTLGYRAFFAGGPYAASAEALTDCKVCFVPREVIVTLLETRPALGLRFLERTARDLEASWDDGLNASSMPVKTRLAHLLVTLKDRLGTVDDGGALQIELPLSRQDIAARIGARPETVTRAIRALEDEGVATFEGRSVRVPDLDRLLDAIELLEV